MRTSFRHAFVLVTFLFCLINCQSAAGDRNTAVPSPQMPASWQVVSDDLAPPEQVSTLGVRMAAQLQGVRNTVYTVNGQRVQLNTIVPATPADAERVMTFLGTIKTEESFLRRGGTIYEFVGPDSVLDHIRAGRQHLQR